MARRLDFKIDQGTDYHFSIRLPSEQGIDLTGYEAAMQIKAAIREAKAAATLTTRNGRIMLEPETGKIWLMIPNRVTAALPAGECVYDLELMSAGGKIYRVLEGKIFVSAGVTNVRLLSTP